MKRLIHPVSSQRKPEFGDLADRIYRMQDRIIRRSGG